LRFVAGAGLDYGWQIAPFRNMKVNRRIPEASALRQFFDEQLGQLRRLLEARQRDMLEQREQARQLRQAVDSIVDGTDARMRAIGSYQKRLRGSARAMLDHIEALVADIPPALEISPAAFRDDPLVNTLFSGVDAIRCLVRQSQPVQRFFATENTPHRHEVFALLFLTRSEKTVFGSEMRGDMMVRGVRQTAVNFSDHQLVAPAATEVEVRSALKRILFDNVIRLLKGQITGMRHARTEAEKTAAARDPRTNIDNPEVYLDMLVEQLSMPARLIRLQDRMLRVSKLGIMLPTHASEASNQVQLFEVELEGMQSRVVTL
jgi:hypothetical protein